MVDTISILVVSAIAGFTIGIVASLVVAVWERL